MPWWGGSSRACMHGSRGGRQCQQEEKAELPRSDPPREQGKQRQPSVWAHACMSTFPAHLTLSVINKIQGFRTALGRILHCCVCVGKWNHGAIIARHATGVVPFAAILGALLLRRGWLSVWSWELFTSMICWSVYLCRTAACLCTFVAGYLEQCLAAWSMYYSIWTSLQHEICY